MNNANRQGESTPPYVPFWS